MRSIARNILFYSFSLFLLTQFLEGVRISGGVIIYLLGGVVLSLMFLIIKPVLNTVALPINLITFGTFSFFINVIILYLLTVFVPQIRITAFVFNGFSFAGFIVPKMHVNSFMAYIASSLGLSVIVTFLTWLIKK